VYPRIAFRSLSTRTALTLAAALFSPLALAQAPDPAAPDPALPDSTAGNTPAPAAEPAPAAAAAATEAAAPPTAAASEGTTAEPAPSTSAGEETTSPVPAPPAPSWYDDFSIGGGVILYYYQPTFDDAKNDISVYFANLILDGHWQHFGLHLEPRFRDTKLRSFYEGPVWLQEAYGSANFGPVTLKVGKAYKLLGLFWDNSFYGNVQVYDGLKLDPNYGISLEGQTGKPFGVEFSAQFFPVDGRTNVSLTNRDTVSVPGARRRNAIVGRVAPSYDFGEGQAHIGLSAEHFEADLPDGEQGVTRAAVEAKVTYRTLGIWGEGLLQKGRHVTDFPYAGDASATPPVPGRASGDNRYLLVGGEYGIGPVTLRYNFSYGKYEDVDVHEVMHVPAIGVALNGNLSVLGEYVDWIRDTPEGDIIADRSINVTVNGHF